MGLLGTMDLSGGEVLTGSNIMLPGTYTLKVVKGESTQTKSGKNQITIVFANSEKQEITEYYNLDSTNKFAKDLMFTLLQSLDNDMTKFNGKITTEMLMNRKLDAVIKRKYNSYSGKWFSKIHKMEKHQNVILNNPNSVEIEAMKNETTQQPKQQQTNFSFEDTSNNLFAIHDDDLPF